MRGAKIGAWLIALCLMVATLPMLSEGVRAEETYTVTVTTDGNGVAEEAPESAAAGDNVWIVVTPNEGYVFQEVQAEGIEEGEEDGQYSIMYSGWPTVGVMIGSYPEGDVSFHFIFTEAVTLTNDANGGTPGELFLEQEIVTKGSEIYFEIFDDFLVPPEGMEYDGVMIDGVRIGPSDPYVAQENVTVVYQWREAGTGPAAHTELVYDPNGGTPTDEFIGARALDPGQEEPVHNWAGMVDPPEGMEFDGVEIDGVRYEDRDTYVVPEKESVTVKFLWKEAAKKCEISFDLNGAQPGEGYEEKALVDVGAEIPVPESFDGVIPPEGTSFAGVELDGTVYAPGDTFTVPDRESVTVKLLWQPSEEESSSVPGESDDSSGETPADSSDGSDNSDKEVVPGPSDGSGDSQSSGGNGGSGQNGDSGSNPKTGDSHSAMLFAALLLFSFAALYAALYSRRALKQK